MSVLESPAGPPADIQPTPVQGAPVGLSIHKKELMLRELVELYARRAREFSDAVARLGQHNQLGPEISGLLIEIRRKGGLCSEAAEKLDRYIEQESGLIASAAASARSAASS